MTWKNGRYLANATSSGRTVSYEYDKNGLRTSKTYNGVKYDYAYAGDKLVWQGWNGNEMYFFYDNTGTPIAFWYFPKGGTRVTGYYFTNQQGDVTRIEDPNGNVLATYAYNAWGRVYASSGSMQSINPLQYRGYYYDTETGFYYLQSRYYDPIVSRFINADSYASTGQGFLGYNMFAYCGNNPVNRVDATGSKHVMIDDYGGKSSNVWTSLDEVCGKIADTLYAPIGSITLDAGVGTGWAFGIPKTEFSISDGINDVLAFHYNPDDGINVGKYTETGGGFSIKSFFGGSSSVGLFESQFIPEHSWFGKVDSEKKTSAGGFVGFSFQIYIKYGGRFRFGFDVDKIINDIYNIWS